MSQLVGVLGAELYVRYFMYASVYLFPVVVTAYRIGKEMSHNPERQMKVCLRFSCLTLIRPHVGMENLALLL